MDRTAEPSGGWAAARRHSEWDWLWESLRFCADPDSYPPEDISGWGHSPWTPQRIGTEVTQAANEWGSAMYFPNAVGTAYSSGWDWQDANPWQVSGTLPSWGQWTVAVAFDHRGTGSNLRRVLHLYTSNFNWNVLLTYNAANRYVYWNDSLMGQLVGPPPGFVNPWDTHRIVVTSNWTKFTKIYYDGFLVAEVADGYLLGRLSQMWVGCDYNQKSSVCLQGTISPLLISGAAWTAEQAAQWSEDPWGFMRPEMHPVISPPFALPPPRFTCAVGERDLPAGTEERDLPAETADRDLPAETAERDLPAETAERDLPAETADRDLPAETDGRDLPAEAEGRDLPAETGDRTVPSPDESSDRETDVEDHEAPRTTDVDEETC